MAIDPDLLVAADMLQDYIVDKDTGFPLANGKISLYEDTNRVIFKNWYYQTGQPGSYSYIALDNPLYLSSVGTIQDPNGNDVIPFYYPFDEDDPLVAQKYYITVYATDENSAPTVLQFTRENFPPDSGSGGNNQKEDTLRNYILNNVYWRNIGSIDATDVLDAVIAPSQHEGYNANPIYDTENWVLQCGSDIRFIKDQGGANDTISFLPMDSVLIQDVTPEYFLRATCTDSTTGETQKCISYPVSLHTATLNDVDATFVIHARDVEGASHGQISIYLYEFLGTGAVNQPEPVLINGGEITLDSAGTTFQKYTLTLNFSPSTVVSSAGDDGWFILVQYPLDLSYSIDHTKPQLYLSDNIPDNDFDTYDQINSIICSPRTGDIRTSLNSFHDFSWVPMDDGTIGNEDSESTTRKNIDTWQLFNLIWYNFQYAQSYAPMFTSAGVPTSYGASAIADFNANNQISLTKSLGQVFAGTSPTINLAQTFTVNTTTDQITVANANFFPTGTPVQFFNTGGALPTSSPQIVSGTVYYSLSVAGSSTLLSVTTDLTASNYANIGDVAAGSIVNYAADYDNGTDGVGATLTDNLGTFLAFSIDGIAGVVGSFYLIKDQASTLQNGIYELTTNGDTISIPWVLTRADYYDSPSEILVNTYVKILGGGTLSNQTWKQDSSVISVGVSAITFSSFSFSIIDFSTTGSGIQYIQTLSNALGKVSGAEETTLLAANLPPHSHSYDRPFGTFTNGAGAPLAGGGINIGFGTGNGPGTSTPFQNLQPTTYMNIFIKL